MGFMNDDLKRGLEKYGKKNYSKAKEKFFSQLGQIGRFDRGTSDNYYMYFGQDASEAQKGADKIRSIGGLVRDVKFDTMAGKYLVHFKIPKEYAKED
jgi:hypothetical protein